MGAHIRHAVHTSATFWSAARVRPVHVVALCRLFNARTRRASEWHSYLTAAALEGHSPPINRYAY